MAKEFAKAFYKSQAWLKCRQGYIALRESIDGGMCEECHNERGYIVHHKILLTPENINDPQTTLNFDNLKFDCKACHDKEEIHGFIKREETLCRFGADGQPIPPLKQMRV